jgi:hypothetical protein
MYYTYAYLREDRTPYYIGKGKNNRAYHPHRHIQVPKDKDKILFLKQNLTEDEAFKHEKYMIAVLGRKDLGTGILRNFTDGGEGTSGRIYSEETKLKISKKHKGKILSEEHRRKISEANKLKPPISEETRKKMSEWQIGRIFSEQSKMKMSESRTGEKNHFYGKKHTEQSRMKMSDSQSKDWNIIDPDGNESIIKNLREFCRNNNLNPGHMVNVAKGKYKQHKGYKCYYCASLSSGT